MMSTRKDDSLNSKVKMQAIAVFAVAMYTSAWKRRLLCILPLKRTSDFIWIVDENKRKIGERNRQNAHMTIWQPNSKYWFKIVPSLDPMSCLMSCKGNQQNDWSVLVHWRFYYGCENRYMEFIRLALNSEFEKRCIRARNFHLRAALFHNFPKFQSRVLI